MHDLVVAEAALRNRPGLYHIGIDNTMITTGSASPLDGRQVLEADGSLTTESFVNAHMHLDKVYTLDRVG